MFHNNEELNFETEYHVTTIQQHAIKTFASMGLGLLITALVAFGMVTTNMTLRLYVSYPIAPMLLLFAQLGVAVAFAARLAKMKAATARILFVAYSILMGVTFSTLAFVYDLGSIGIAFGITAVYFGCLVIIGYTTKMNLLRFGPILMGGLLTLIIVEVVMTLLGMDITTRGFTAIGLLLFTGITAYDTQKMKALYHSYEGDESMLSKLSIYSAFDLYLDFINIFLYILRFVGNRD